MTRDPIPDSGRDIFVPVGSEVMGLSGRASSVQSLLTSTLEEVSLNAGFAVPLPARPKLGVDVVDIGVLERQLRSHLGPEFKRRIFTEAEIADCRDKPAKFATRWAVKEAVSKAIGTGFREGLHPVAVEIFTAVDGSIGVGPASGCGWPRGADCWTWTVSAAHESGVAVAVVIGIPN